MNKFFTEEASLATKIDWNPYVNFIVVNGSNYRYETFDPKIPQKNLISITPRKNFAKLPNVKSLTITLMYNDNAIIEKIALRQRNLAEEITLDMAGNIGLIAKKCFPNATRVIDRFHVQKLASEALQEIRIKYRWQAIEQENEAIEKARKKRKRFEPEVLNNGDTLKQIMA